MKRGTKIGWLLIAVSIMLSVWVIVSTSSNADTDPNGYVIADDGVTLTGIPDTAAISIPDGITTIKDDVFKDKTGITTITIPNSVTNLGTGFQGCTALQTVTIGTGVTSLGADTFYNCTTLNTVNFPSTLKTISENAFHGCTGLKTVDLPASCSSVDSNAFRGCNNMVGFSLSGGSSTYSVSADNCLYSLDGTTLVNVPDGKTTITIPASCTTIATGAFNGCAVDSVTIPATVTSIDTQSEWTPSEIWGVDGSAAYEYAMLNDITFCATDGSGSGGGDGSSSSYNITAGANQTWTKGSGADLTITGDGDFSKFTGVQIDGSTIGAENYTAVSGSTIVTLKSSYLETLSNGNHTFTMVWNDGTASTTLKVAAADSSSTTGYTITSGANQTWTKGSGTTIKFTGSGPLSEFAGIKVDGTTVGASNYSTTTSPTIITLSNAYLESLGVGNHSLTVVWTGGTATANFTVAAPGKDSTGSTSKTTTTTTTKTTSTGASHTKDSTPQTADLSIDPRYFLALGVMLAGIAIVINGRGKQFDYVNKKRNN